MQQVKDFCIIGTCGMYMLYVIQNSTCHSFSIFKGVWQQLDKMRGYTTMQQKVAIMRQLATAHFPDILPYFSVRLDHLAEHSQKYFL